MFGGREREHFDIQRPDGKVPPSSARRRPASQPRTRGSSPFVCVSAERCCGAACGLGESAQVCREPGSRVPKTPPGVDAGKRPEVAWELRLPRRGVRPGSRPPTPPGSGLRHSPMSPSSSSSSSSSMFSRTFLVIICMSPRGRCSAALGCSRLRSARAASSAQPSRHCPGCATPALCLGRRCSACD